MGKPPCRMPPVLRKRAREKPDLIHAARTLEDLRVPPANRLERRAGDREGQYSVRVNDQWRICLRWIDGEAYGVELVDYHAG